MTVPERLSAHPVSFHRSCRRASARNSEVRLKSDAGAHRPHPKIRNRPAVRSGTADRVPPSRSSLSLLRTTSHLPHIEIP
jgi:hypothetical protein